MKPFGAMTFSITTLGLLKFSITKISLKGIFATLSKMALSKMAFSITKLYIECRHYGECCVSFIIMLSDVMLNTVMLSVMAPNFMDHFLHNTFFKINSKSFNYYKQ
jgi:hypothetical protein